ncbi:unnamed protein product (macronuclear) [Paramecium tetraurelia]|uniref:Dihydroorotate dehydrogenase catalytic domain-containing protein n=1 Tax=Paramecium tetraurelia TaxID=5888 RepID=A0DS83_PARTE|nr:uncharacterized protein GSPATT00019604001 [Paramecium tetraurelia]CAK85900.1 unnamed protein product [Paramecium tetraurelia]|eukprot:XP_001453297.1 hypothetical protein (macronuclear) [Paramecium tetraurelia strain d4-2]
MLKKLKPILLSVTTIGVGYFCVQRELNINLGIFDAFYYQLYKYSPHYAVQFIKLMSYQNLLWKQDLYTQEQNLNDQIKLKNQLGLASGFDNDGSFVETLQNLGFGFIEIGSITAQRNIRFSEDLNTYSVKNDSIEYLSEIPQMGILQSKAILTSLRRNYAIKIPVGVSIMPSEEIYKYTPYLIENDISNVTRELCTVADFLVLNLVSSQRTSKLYNDIVTNNTDVIKKMIQSIQITQIEEIGLQAALEHETKNELKGDNQVREYLSTTQLGLKQQYLFNIIRNLVAPLYIKVSSNIQKTILDFLLEEAKGNKIQGIILQKDINQNDLEYNKTLKQVRQQLPKSCTLISVGGIKTKVQFQERLNNGADACQIFSSFVAKGPHVIKDILL